nr:unnamed protein product [Callosobruchus chinensis]
MLSLTILKCSMYGWNVYITKNCCK